MVAYFLQVTLCMAVFYGFYHVALRHETMFRLNRLYLLSTLLISFILPLIKIYVDAWEQRNTLVKAPLYMATYVQSMSEGIVITPDSSGVSWTFLLMILYGAVVAVLLIKMLWSVFTIQRIKKQGQRLDIGGRTCIVSSDIKCPFSFFNTIYMPQDHAFTPLELEEVVLHETAHVRGHHTIDVLVAELACILFWPSPMVYLYRKALKDLHEYLADSEVIQHTPWDTYASMLIANKDSSFQMRLSNHLIFSQLKKRLLMMNKKPSSAWMKFKYAGMIPLLLLALVFFSFRLKESNPGIPVHDAGKVSLHTAVLDPIRELQPLGGALSALPQMKADPASADSGTPNPIFPGCNDQPAEMQEACGTKKLYEFISTNLVYPESVRKSGIEGKVFVKFVVGADGFVKNATILQSLHHEADQAVLNLVNSMNQKAGKWSPSMKDGKAIDAEMILPVMFKLDLSEKKEVVQYAEEMPRMSGCEHITETKEKFQCTMDRLFGFIQDNLKYPQADRNNKVEGTGIVQFVVTTEGSLTDIRVVRSPSETITAELQRLFTKMKSDTRWIPGKDKGQLVNVQYTVPVKFLLDPTTSEVDKPEGAESSSDSSEKQQDQIVIIPNPSSTSISFDLFEGATTLILVDAGGNQVLSRKVSEGISPEMELNISALLPGRYMVQLSSGTKVKTGSFIKE